MTNQSNAAAERSAHVTRGGDDEQPADDRLFFWVVLEGPDGRLLRYWHTRMREMPFGARVRFTTTQPRGATPE